MGKGRRWGGGGEEKVKVCTGEKFSVNIRKRAWIMRKAFFYDELRGLFVSDVESFEQKQFRCFKNVLWIFVFFLLNLVFGSSFCFNIIAWRFQRRKFTTTFWWKNDFLDTQNFQSFFFFVTTLMEVIISVLKCFFFMKVIQF